MERWASSSLSLDRGRVASYCATACPASDRFTMSGNDCLLPYSGCTLCFLNSFLDLRIELRRLAAIGHPVLANDANATMAQLTSGYRLRRPTLGGGRILPCDEKQQLARIGDALEDLLIDDALATGLRQPEVARKICAGRLLAFRRESSLMVSTFAVLISVSSKRCS